MGQSMRRAMIALGLAEPDAPAESRVPEDRDPQRSAQSAGPRDRPARSDRPDSGQRSQRSQAPVGQQASARRDSTEPAGRASSTQRGPEDTRSAPAAQSAPRGRTQQSRRDAEYRAPVTPIKRAPSTSRENADDMRTITTVHPRSYNDAKSVGESFRDGTPVIMDLTDLGEAEAKRLVDFAAGLVYALHGSIERVTTTVFLLTPSYVEVVDNTAGAADESAEPA
ncbi:cell division protein SepF [Kocuria sp.]|uniref:cell division protein SepF n=1 Tax=Kocuria sp. TaxID=1871328 RepID=UPI0026DF2EDC|nr:cell division protein SepF [Kocuria sp.]MDO5618445.1 cell division protein SepF [Kocuria sp.]